MFAMYSVCSGVEYKGNNEGKMKEKIIGGSQLSNLDRPLFRDNHKLPEGFTISEAHKIFWT